MPGTTCERCGFAPKDPAKSLYYSAMAERTQCVSAAACKKRRDRRPQYSDWTSPSFEQQMST
jgi:hypothetical protein